MGFRLNRTYALTFEGDLKGAEVHMRSTAVATVMKVRSGLDLPDLADQLAQHVERWNLDTREGTPLPIDAGAILAELEQPVIIAICRAWLQAATGVTAPLDDGSTSGEQSPEVDLPMEASSPSQES